MAAPFLARWPREQECRVDFLAVPGLLSTRKARFVGPFVINICRYLYYCYCFCILLSFVMFEAAVDLFEIMKYVGSGERPFVEGEAILKAKHIMECGLTSRTEQEFRVLGLCLQSSHLNSRPHEIKIWVKATASPKISGTCSCKAGSGKCKHIVAVLLFLNR
jgi:SWIM zinc finger